MLCSAMFLISCSGSSSTGVSTNIFTPGTNLYTWPIKTISISHDWDVLREAAKPWEQTGVKFEFGKSGMIAYRGMNQSNPLYCGWTVMKYNKSKKMIGADIYLNPGRVYTESCRGPKGTLTHEIGHAIGIHGHTTDGSIMEPRLINVKTILSVALVNAIKSVYSSVPYERVDYSPEDLKRNEVYETVVIGYMGEGHH